MAIFEPRILELWAAQPGPNGWISYPYNFIEFRSLKTSFTPNYHAKAYLISLARESSQRWKLQKCKSKSKSKSKSKMHKNIPRKYMKSLSKNQVGGESCLLETAHHTKIQYPNKNPNKNPKSKKTFLENI